MSINKSIFYQLCNKGIMVNLYKLLFLSSHFSFQSNKRVFHPPTFPSLQPNTHEGKLNIFHPPTFPSSYNFPTFPSSYNFPSFHFSTPPTKRTLKNLYGIRVPRPTWALDLDPTIRSMTPTPLFEARP